MYCSLIENHFFQCNWANYEIKKYHINIYRCSYKQIFAEPNILYLHDFQIIIWIGVAAWCNRNIKKKDMSSESCDEISGFGVNHIPATRNLLAIVGRGGELLWSLESYTGVLRKLMKRRNIGSDMENVIFFTPSQFRQNLFTQKST